MWQSILDLFILGGPIVVLLVGFSLVSATIILLKCWQLWQQRALANAHPDTALQLVEKGEPHQALMLMQNQPHCRAKLIAKVLHLLDQGALSLEDVRDEASRLARKLLSHLQSYLRVLEVVAMVAPLLGLFGTVLGMIVAFQAMAEAGAQVNPAVLSNGIWKALMTTAAGLAVAIPVSLLHSVFERRVERYALAMGDDLQRLLTHQKTQLAVIPLARKKLA